MVLSTLAARRTGHLLGPAPGVSVLLAKTEDISQEVPLEEDHWVAGLEWAESLGAEIIFTSRFESTDGAQRQAKALVAEQPDAHEVSMKDDWKTIFKG